MDKMVFFNIAWMKKYRGITEDDRPVGGGLFVDEEGYGAEIYNFQPFRGRMYGFVEAGYEPRCCIRIERLGASKRAQLIPGILVVWVARHPNKSQTLVVGWYKNATVYKERQKPPAGSNRKLPNGEDAPYFVEADEQNCKLIPESMRDCEIPRGEQGALGNKNIWYAESQLGAKVKAKVIEYISNWEGRCKAGGGC